MADASLAVVISANTSDFNAKMALAQANLRAFSAETRSAATAITSTIDPSDAQFRALTQASGAMASARAQVAQLNAAQSSLRASAHEAAEGQEGLRLATSGSTREFIVLGHEVLTGNFHRIPGSIVVLTERMGALHQIIGAITGTMVAAGAGALAFAGALAAIAISAYRANEALNIANRAFQLAGLPEGQDQIRQWTEAVRKMPGVSAEAAGKIVADWAKVTDATPQLVSAMLRVLPALGSSEEEIADKNKALVASFQDLGGAGRKLLESLNPATVTLKSFDDAVAGGQRAEAMGVLLAQLAQNASQVTDTTGRAALAVRGFGESLMEAIGVAETGQAGASGIDAMAQATKGLDAAKVREFTDAMRAAEKAPTTKPVTALPTGAAGEQVDVIRSNLKASQAQIEQDTLAFWQRQRELAVQAGDSTKEIDTQIGKTQLDIAKATSEQLISDTRDRVSRIEATERGSASGRLAAERGAWAAILNSDQLSYKDREEAQRAYNALSVQLDNTSRGAQLATIRAATDATKAGTSERVAAAQRELAETTRLYGQGSEQAIEAQKRLTAATQAETQERARIAIEGDNAQIAQLTKLLDAQIKNDDKARELHRISIQQQLGLDLAAVNAFETQQLAAINNEIATAEKAYGRDSTQFAAAEAKKTEIEQSATQQRVAINDKAVQEMDAANKKLATDFQQAMQPLGPFFDSIMQGMLTKGNNFSQTFTKAFDKLAIDVIEDITKMMAKWLAYEALTSASKALGATGQQTLIGNPFGAGATGLGALFGGSGGGLSAALGFGTQAATGAASGAAQSAPVVAAITTETGTLVTSNTATSTAIVSAVTTQAGITATSATADSATVTGALATGFASVVSAIGIETTTLAGLLTAEFAKPSVLGTTFATGTANVPFTGMALVHAGEIIIPANIASQIRSGTAYAGVAGGASLTPDIAALLSPPHASVAATPALAGGTAGGTTSGASSAAPTGAGPNFTVNINANDSKSFGTYVNNGTVSRAVTAMVARTQASQPQGTF
jgi:hypothetical protein